MIDRSFVFLKNEFFFSISTLKRIRTQIDRLYYKSLSKRAVRRSLVKFFIVFCRKILKPYFRSSRARLKCAQMHAASMTIRLSTSHFSVQNARKVHQKFFFDAQDNLTKKNLGNILEHRLRKFWTKKMYIKISNLKFFSILIPDRFLCDWDSFLVQFSSSSSTID